MRCWHCGKSIPEQRLVQGSKYCSDFCESVRTVPSRFQEQYFEEELPATAPAQVEAPTPRRIVIDQRHEQKAAVIRDYAKRFHCPYFVETGTAYGETVEAVRNDFLEVWTIELSQHFYELALANFANIKNVHPIQGDSGERLLDVIPFLNRRTVFWLDAHWSGGATIRGREDTPILRELDAILKNVQVFSVILIDDVRSFRKDPTYPKLDALKDYIIEEAPGAFLELIGDIIAVTYEPSQETYPQSDTCQIHTLAEIYKKEFGYHPSGFFMDVGAADGWQFSNTWGLAQAGWEGICLEPDPDRAAACRQEYKSNPLITVIEAAAGAKSGKASLYRGLAPTTSLETVKANPWGFGYTPEPIEVEQVTLNSLFRRLNVPKEFEVLSIDVDGAELEVLAGLNLKTWKPRLIILETCKDHPYPSYHFHTEQIEAAMAKADYVEIYHDAINSIFRRATP